MQTIYRYTIKPSVQVQEIRMYYGAKILSVGRKKGDTDISIWTEIDTEFPTETHKFFCVGTGWNLSKLFNYKKVVYHGTVIDDDDEVWHLYEVAYEYKDDEH